ncbi:hypothetical protein GCM10009733_023380 [Nonomuraea maheshkhaliensis]|uniref:AB hydrolase-1 domain-containing protein n=1 Tax=Nonomuraea maheshkhaliensis TaxID=419590 RepID=A0ABP4QY49_9ACTN
MTERNSATEIARAYDEGNRGSDGRMRRFTIEHDGVTIPVSRGGRGRPLVLCPGLSSTQASLRELAGLLRRDHDVVTFDLRGHGLASAADRYSFDDFLGDLTAVMAAVKADVTAETGGRDLPGRREPAAEPVLVGYSLGADLAVHYASEHPDAVAGLVLIDGANPVPEPFVTEAVLPEFRTMWAEQAALQEAERGTERQVLLTAEQLAGLNVEIDVIRSGILDRYRKIDRPISMIMSTSMAGDDAGEHARRFNRNWRAGVERLVRERPDTTTTWLEADHRLVFTHAEEIARLLGYAPEQPGG